MCWHALYHIPIFRSSNVFLATVVVRMTVDFYGEKPICTGAQHSLGFSAQSTLSYGCLFYRSRSLTDSTLEGKRDVCHFEYSHQHSCRANLHRHRGQPIFLTHPGPCSLLPEYSLGDTSSAHLRLGPLLL